MIKQRAQYVARAIAEKQDMASPWAVDTLGTVSALIGVHAMWVACK